MASRAVPSYVNRTTLNPTVSEGLDEAAGYWEVQWALVHSSGLPKTRLYDHAPVICVLDASQPWRHPCQYLHCVMHWDPGAEHGIIAARGNGHGFRLDQLHHPKGVAVEHDGALLVVSR